MAIGIVSAAYIAAAGRVILLPGGLFAQERAQLTVLFGHAGVAWAVRARARARDVATA